MFSNLKQLLAILIISISHDLKLIIFKFLQLLEISFKIKSFMKLLSRKFNFSYSLQFFALKSKQFTAFFV
jgi:hypothetical protein